MPDLFTEITTTEELTVVSTEREGLGEGFLSLEAKAKELNKQIGWVITQRKTEYLPDLLRLREHSSVQIRRKIADGLGSIGTKDILYEVKEWQTKEADRQAWLTLESLIDKLERGVTGLEMEKDAKILTVTEAIGIVKKLLGEGTYVIEGELTEVRPVREFYYFGLKDSQDARLDCFSLGRVVSRAGFALNEGLNVRVEGKFKLGKNSRLIFDIHSIKLTGEGELLRNLKLLEDKLRKEGVFDPLRKRQLPRLPKNILLLASPNSAAIADFEKVLFARRKGLNIYYLPIKTQGVGSEFDILQNLELANEIIPKYSIDTIVLTRGGGSSDDLFVFNSEKIVRALHGLHKPVIVAIGHERDTTLAELAADLRASTPSNAAELVSLSSQEVISESSLVIEQLTNQARVRINEYRGAGEKMVLVATNMIRSEILHIRQEVRSTDRALAKMVFGVREEVTQFWFGFIEAVKRNVYASRANLLDMKLLNAQMLNRVNATKYEISCMRDSYDAALLNHIQRIKSDFESTRKQIQLSDPKNILEKGFVIVKKDGKIVLSKDQTKSGETLQVNFKDGEVDTVVK